MQFRSVQRNFRAGPMRPARSGAGLDSQPMEATAATVRMSRLAIVSVVAGILSLVSAYAVPIALLWVPTAPIPGPYFVASALPILPPVVAIACGHAALLATRGGVLRGRRAAWTGLACGYAGLVQTLAFEGLLWFIIRLPIQY
jgi:hypothetical protein